MISLPVQTAVWPLRAVGTLMVLVAIQLSVVGLYLPPLPSTVAPHTNISLPVQVAVWLARALGALAVLVGIQVSVPGSYLAPVLNSPTSLLCPPQMIISVPVEIAV